MCKKDQQYAACTVQDQIIDRDNIVKMEARAKILCKKGERQDAKIIKRLKAAVKK